MYNDISRLNISDLKYMDYVSKYNNIIIILNNEEEGESFLEYIKPFVDKKIITSCYRLIDIANEGDEYPIYIRIYMEPSYCDNVFFRDCDNVFFRGWDKLSNLDRFAHRSTYEKLYYIDDIFNGVLYNIIVNGCSSEPNNKPKNKIKRNLNESTNTLKYYNSIKKESTEYPYRFMTLYEFENKYGKYWYLGFGTNNWAVGEMDYLYGETLRIKENDLLINRELSTIVTYMYKHNKYDNSWSIAWWMLLPNIPIPTYNTKKNKRIIENVINETADNIKLGNKVLNYYDDDAYAFLYLNGYDKNNFLINQGLSHVDMVGNYLYSIKDKDYMDIYYTENMNDYLYDIVDESEFKGRLWLNSKVMSFWDLSCDDYDIKIFKEIIKNIEKKLKININFKEWKVEFFDIEKQSTFFVSIENFIEKNINDIGGIFTSMEDYEKMKKQHLDKNKNKKVLYGYGSKNPKNKPLNWKQLLYSEKINYNGSIKITESINNIYYNKIKQEYTQYPYRFKTKNEFEEEFGNGWHYIVRKNWNDNMDFMFGMDYPFMEFDQFKRVDRFYVSMDMLIPNLHRVPIYDQKSKNKRLLENKLNEDCDFVNLPNGDKLTYTDNDAYPFFYIDNKFMVGDPGDNHTNLLSDYLYSINDYSIDNLKDYYFDKCEFKGRYWLNSKVISFWEYINTENLKRVLKDIEKHLKIEIDTDKWLLDYYVNDDFNYDSSKNLIPISEYLMGNFEDHTYDVDYQRKKEEHFKSPLLKKKHTPKGFGSKSPKYKPLDWRQALYTENFKFDKLPYNMFVFKIGDEDIDYVKNSLKKLGVDISYDLVIVPNSDYLFMFFTEGREFNIFRLYKSGDLDFSLDDFLEYYRIYKSSGIFSSYNEFENFINKKLLPTYKPKKNIRILENQKYNKILNCGYDILIFKIGIYDDIEKIKKFLNDNEIVYNDDRFYNIEDKYYTILIKKVDFNKNMELLFFYRNHYDRYLKYLELYNLVSSPIFSNFDELKKFINDLPLKSVDMYKPKTMNRRILEMIESKMDIPGDVYEFYDLFEKSNKKLYIVGGAVRDYLMGKKPHDFDMVTDAQPNEVVDILKVYRTDIHGVHFGVVRVYTESEPQGYEIASYRKDISKGRNTKGTDKKVETGRHITIKDDVNRRDLTINALFYNIKTGEIIDTVGGLKDIKNNVIKAVGNPSKRFDEDRLRILRTIRFAAVTGGKIDEQTSRAILQDNRLFGISEEDDVSRERIFAEFLKVKEKARKNRDGDIITRFINLLIDYDIMSQIFPVLVTEKNITSTQYLTVSLAQCLRHNVVNDEFKKTLIDAKIPTSYINIISILIKIFRNGIKVNDVYNTYREVKSNGVRHDILSEWVKVMRINDKRVVAFLEYEPSTTGHDVIKDGFKKQEIGKEISRRESDKFTELLKKY